MLKADYFYFILCFTQVAASHHSKEHYQALQLRRCNGVSGLAEPERADSICEETSPMPLAPLPPLARLKSDPNDDQQEENETEEEQQLPPDNQTLLRLLEQNEKVLFCSNMRILCYLFLFVLDYVHV